MEIIYTKNNTKIIDSYKYDPKLAARELFYTRQFKDLPTTRPLKSYIREIKAHNRLYKLGIARSHTKDTDCEENIAKWKEMLWRIIGG